MRVGTIAGIALAILAFVAAPVTAQSRGSKALPPEKSPLARTPPSTAPSGGLVIAPSKPVVAPGVKASGDSGATPAGARSANAKTVSVSARQAAEQTIAALVAAMKNLPKRPPAPPESRTPRAQRADGARGQAFDPPTPINYHVTWPATPPEPYLDRRVELDWPGKSTGGPVSLRWNQPNPD